MRHLLPLLVFSLGITGATNSAAAEKKMKPPALQDVAGVWIGGTVNDEIEFLRLELDRNGTGLLTLSEIPGPGADAYFVRATHLQGFDISFTLEPVDKDSEPISLHGRFPYVMRLTLSGKDNAWSREVYLRDQAWFMKRLHEVEKRASEVRQRTGGA